MKRKYFLGAGLLVLLCLCLVGWTTHSQNKARVQWEYKVISLSDDVTITRELNEEGSEGWELVGFQMKSPQGKYGQRGLYYFKRQK